MKPITRLQCSTERSKWGKGPMTSKTKSIAVPLDPQLAADALKQHFSFDDLCGLVAYLQEGMAPLERTLLTAPFGDEPETEEERAAVAEALAEIERGEPLLSMEDIKREFGLSDGPTLSKAALHQIVDGLPDRLLDEAGWRLEELSGAQMFKVPDANHDKPNA